MLPGIRGEEVCRRLKARPSTARIPIIMLTALGEAEDCVAGLELGADDYVSKPFSPRELILRLQAILQRRSGAGRSANWRSVPFASIVAIFRCSSTGVRSP